MAYYFCVGDLEFAVVAGNWDDDESGTAELKATCERLEGVLCSQDPAAVAELHSALDEDLPDNPAWHRWQKLCDFACWPHRQGVDENRRLIHLTTGDRARRLNYLDRIGADF